MFVKKEIVEEVDQPLHRDQPWTRPARACPSRPDWGMWSALRSSPSNFGRIAAQTARQVIIQGMREAEQGMIYDDVQLQGARDAHWHRHPDRPPQRRGHPAHRPAAAESTDAYLSPSASRSGARADAGGRPAEGLCGGGPPLQPRGPRSSSPAPIPAWSSACLSWRCPEIYDGTVEIKLHRPGGRQPHQAGRLVRRRQRGPHRRLRGPQGRRG